MPWSQVERDDKRQHRRPQMVLSNGTTAEFVKAYPNRVQNLLQMFITG
jgi:hypothetical protein